MATKKAKKTTAKKVVAKKAAAPKAAKKAATASARTPVDRARYDWKGAEEAAASGKMPKAPDFSAPTHARFLPIFDEVKKAASAGDIAALKKIEIATVSSTPKAMDRYRNLCVKALQAKA